MCALSGESRANDSHSKIEGNYTLVGQIATFIDVLHLSFDEVFDKIPYSILILMQKDRLHEVVGSEVEYKTGRDTAKLKQLEDE